MPSAVDTTLPQLEDTSSRKEWQVLRHVGWVQNPQLFQLGHFLGSKQFQIPWKTGKNGIYGSEGPYSLQRDLLPCD